MHLTLYFCLVEKQVKSVKTTKEFLQMLHFLLRSSIELLFCLVVLWNNDGDKIYLKFLILLHVVFCRKISSIRYLLFEIDKWFLIIVLRVILCNQIAWSRKSGLLQFRFSCLCSSEIFNIWKLLFHFTWLEISGN